MKDRCDLLAVDLPVAEALRQSLPTTDEIREAALRAKGLADPTRLRIALALGEAGELCVCDLAWVCEASEKITSHHARELRSAGLADSRREGKMVMYSLTGVGRELLASTLAAGRSRA
jgi:ArsR family transcriptional regulator, lead/cadmium/zinc/bismuth-responsive transcriptional repressor